MASPTYTQRRVGGFGRPASSKARIIQGWIAAVIFASTLVTVLGQGVADACLVLTGLGGVPEYEENFQKWGKRIEAICSGEKRAQTSWIDGRESGRTQVMELFERLSAEPLNELWIFLIGHGTYDGRNYKFNIKGPDLTDDDLRIFLDSVNARRSFVVLGTSSSGILLSKLKGDHRVILSATKSEREKRPPLFMSFFLEAAGSAEADLNKDGRISLQEAFDFSASKVGTWYEEKGRIQTEHPLLEDGAGSGQLAALGYLSSPPEQAYRSLEARSLVPERIRLEREIEDLKLRKAELSTADYYQQLEPLLIALAEVSEKIRQLEENP